MLHEHSAPVAELQRDVDRPGWAKPPDVLAAFLPSRNIGRTSVASQGLALLEVNMDRVIPSTATVFQMPDFACAEARPRRDPTEIRRERSSLIVRLDAPGAEGRRDRVVGR